MMLLSDSRFRQHTITRELVNCIALNFFHNANAAWQALLRIFPDFSCRKLRIIRFTNVNRSANLSDDDSDPS
jgi:hypothetical protein